jgi:spore germination protein KB
VTGLNEREGDDDMTRKISTRQMLYAVAAFILASSLLTRSLYQYTKTESWISIVIGGFFSFAVISIYGRLEKNHPGAGLNDINAQVFGTVPGKIVSALYVFFFLTLTVFNTQDLGSFVNFAVLQNTPLNVTYFAFLIVCVYAVRKGATALTRYGTFITVAYIVLLVFNSLLLLNRTQPKNLLPVLTLPVKNYLLSAHTVAMLPFCEILAFMMLAPYMQNPAELGAAMKKGFLIAALTILFIIMRDISILGGYATYASMPTYAVVRLIDIGDILTRLEIIYAVTLITLLFFKVSILYFGTVKGFSQLFGIEKYEVFTFMMGVLVIVCAGSFFTSDSEHTEWFRAAATYSTFFLFILPAVTLIVSEIRKKADADKQKTNGGEYI